MIAVLVLVVVRNVEEEIAKCVPNTLKMLDALQGPGFYLVLPE